MNEGAPPVVTLDGPAGSGKGAVGQRLALEMGWHFLDSGALYRACAYILKRERLDSSQAVARLRRIAFLSVPDVASGDSRVLIDSEDVTSKVRTSACGELASKLAAKPHIRDCLLDVQQRMRRMPGLVADGRDMGTVVFPDAAVKIYLTADLRIRAKRKHEQLKQMGNYVKLSNLYNEMKERDYRDSTRAHAPLAKPAGAVTLDTSHMTLEQVLGTIVMSVRAGLT